MRIARVNLAPAAEADLHTLGEVGGEWLFGDLRGALIDEPEDRYPLLSWQKPGEEVRRVEIGDYTATFSVEFEKDGSRSAGVERVVLRGDLDRWIAEQIEAAEADG